MPPVKSAKRAVAASRRRATRRASAPRPNQLDLVLKYWPLSAPLSFLLANGMLIAIFGRWHLAFMQLVGPADLIIPGFVFGVFAMLVPSLSYMMGLIIDAAASAIGESRRPVIVLAGMVIVAIAFILSYFALGGALGQQMAFLAVWTELGFAAHVLYRWKVYKQRRRWRATLILPSLALPSLLTVFWMGLTVDMFAAQGMTGGLEIGPTEKLQCRGRVMWLGDKSTIIRCAETSAHPGQLVILVGGDRVLSPPLASRPKYLQTQSQPSRTPRTAGPTP